MNAILNLAMEIDLSETDFNNLVDNIVNSYCSQNLTSIEPSAIKIFLQNKLQKIEKNFEISKIKVDKKINQLISKDKLLAREMNENIHLFRNFCSWEGKPETTDLMSFYVSSPHFHECLSKNNF